MADGLQMSDVVANQQGQTPAQLAQTAQSSTLPASAAPNFNTDSSTNLQSTPQVTLPTPPPPSTATANGMVAGAGATSSTVAGYMNQLTPPTTALDTQNQSILDSIASLTGQDANKGADTLALQTQNGVQTKQQAVTDANNEIATKTANYAQLQANLGGNNSVETKAVLAAQNAGLLKAQAADIGVSQAKLTASQGNLSLAQQQVTDAINLKYSTIEAGIQTKQAQLAAIQPMLSKQQATEAAAQQQVLKDQADAVAAQKATETQINTIAMNAAAAGADTATLSAITNSKDVLSAINAAAPALGAKAANDLKQQTFDNAIKLRTAANDAARVGIEQENANLALAKFQQDNANAAKTVTNATVTTPSGKKYVDGTGLDAAGKTAALNAGQVVLDGQSAQAMTAINNVQGQVGSLLSALQTAGVDLTKITNPGSPTQGNQGGTNGFLQYHAAGSATPAVVNFGTNLKSMITDLQKLPGTGSLVSTLQNNVLTGKEDSTTMQTKITNITKALEDSQNALLVNNSQPAQIVLNGKTLTLQADGTYQ